MKTLDETIAWLEYVNATTYPSNFEGAVYHLKTLKDENNKLFGKVSSLEQHLKDAISSINNWKSAYDGAEQKVTSLEQQLKDALESWKYKHDNKWNENKTFDERITRLEAWTHLTDNT